MRNIQTSRLVLWTAVVALACASAHAVEPPRLAVEAAEGASLLFVEGVTPAGDAFRQYLGETRGTPEAGPAAWGPASTGFVTWSGEGSGRWASFSRDAGATWSEPRSYGTTLRLLAGATAPGAALPAVPSAFAAPADGELFLVQFSTVVQPAWKAALASAGATPLQYFPHNAFVARMDPARADAVRALGVVERIEPFHPWYRVDPELQEWVEAGTVGGVSAADELRVRAMAFEWGADAKRRILQAAEAAGGRSAAFWPSGHVVELFVTRAQLTAIASHPDLAWVDRWTAPETDMDLVRQDAGSDAVQAALGACGQGVRGEVMDSGIQLSHPDFGGNVLLHTASTSGDSHGTSTYGIVFGSGGGDATATGHMPCAEQGIFGDFDAVSDRFAYTQELKSSPYFASFQTNSWGGGRTTAYNSQSAEMDDIIFRLDIAITQSQSNAGNQQSRPQAWAKNVVSVGGIRHRNTLDTADDAWSSGASIGPAADGRLKPDVNYWYDSIRTTTTNSGYTSTFGGTSAATPEVAGVLGLMIQMWADDVWGTNPQGATVFDKQPHFGTMKAFLINYANQYPFTGPSSDLTRTHQGWGRPNAELARTRAPNSFVVDQDVALTLGQSSFHDVRVEAGESELKITMTYPDPMGTTSSTLHRINDVDLEVTSPSGTVYHGNVGLDAGNYSTAGGSPNSIDTVENVFVQNPEAGRWTIEVRAAEVNQDGHLDTPGNDVVYALVVSGATEDLGVCGDDEVGGNEQCDGADLGGETCESQGCTGGTLACDSGCSFDFSGCTGCPTCDDDGVCEGFEDCNTCPGDCPSSSGGASCGNGICEAGDGEDCVSCPSDCNGVTNGKPSNRFCCGSDVACSDSRCTQGGLQCLDSPSGASCCGDGVCEGSEDSCACAVDCGAPAAAETVGSTCTDGVDNDCDGVADCEDSNCAADPTCDVCDDLGNACEVDSDCCTAKCKGPSGRKTCK